MSLDTIIELSNAEIVQSEKTVLNEVNVKVIKGEFVYLIGKTASGKSSLIKTMYGELPFKGDMGFVAGFDLRKLRASRIPYLRRKVGIVFQDFQLLTDRSVNDNLVFVLRATGWKNKKDIAERISDVLEKVDLLDKLHKMPYQLSGGEQQRIVIARALLNDPDLILADEPTGNLDPETSDEIMKLLVKISQTGRAVMMATHNYNLLKKFPGRTLRCEHGKLIEIVDNEELIDFDQLMIDDEFQRETESSTSDVSRHEAEDEA